MNFTCSNIVLGRCKECPLISIFPYAPSPYYDSKPEINCKKYDEARITILKEDERMLIKQRE